MKKYRFATINCLLLTLLLTCFLMISCQFRNDNSSNVIKTFYPNGKIMSITKLVNDTLTNIDEYYPSGNLHKRVSLVREKHHGKARIFYDNGNVKKEMNYKFGVPNGVYKNYYENGSLEGFVTYVNGKKEGKKALYHLNGNLIQVVVFHNDVVVYDKDYIYENDKSEKLASTREDILLITEGLYDTLRLGDYLKWTFKIPKVDSTAFDYSKFFVQYDFVEQDSSYEEKGFPLPSLELPLIDGIGEVEGSIELVGNYFIYGSLKYKLEEKDTTLSTFKQKFTIVTNERLE